MSRPTIAGLTEELKTQKARTERVRKVLDGIDEEARAYSDCVNALSKLKRPDSGGSLRSTSHDRDAVRRVIDALKERFDISEDKVEPIHQDFHYEEPTDPRSDVIAQLIEALRKS